MSEVGVPQMGLRLGFPTFIVRSTRTPGRQTRGPRHLFTLALLALPAASGVAFAAGDMQAAVIVDGGVQFQKLPKPEPQAGEVRIKVRDASVNPTDWKRADHSGPGTRGTPGRDLSGVIDALGPAGGPSGGAPSQWKVGDPVIAIAPGGSYAEYAIAPLTAIAAKPARMSAAT